MKKTDINSNDLYPHPSSLGDDIYKSLCDLNKKNIIIISTTYHKKITGSMAYSYIKNSTLNSIGFIEVSGAFEIPLATKLIIEKFRPMQVLALGCVIKGETKHDEYLSSTVINGLRNLSLEYKIPVINGILTTNNIQQAVDRAGKKYDKGKGFFDSSILMHEVIAKINKRTND
tara:strand:+ start:209 stop:727 length:519 start_codon:yes stop_codon:yes gene_type:complete